MLLVPVWFRKLSSNFGALQRMMQIGGSTQSPREESLPAYNNIFRGYWELAVSIRLLLRLSDQQVHFRVIVFEFTALGNYKKGSGKEWKSCCKEWEFCYFKTLINFNAKALPPTQPIMDCILSEKGITFQERFKCSGHPHFRGSFRDRWGLLNFPSKLK